MPFDFLKMERLIFTSFSKLTRIGRRLTLLKALRPKLIFLNFEALIHLWGLKCCMSCSSSTPNNDIHEKSRFKHFYLERIQIKKWYIANMRATTRKTKVLTTNSRYGFEDFLIKVRLFVIRYCEIRLQNLHFEHPI